MAGCGINGVEHAVTKTTVSLCIYMFFTSNLSEVSNGLTPEQNK
jgi:hypothetical protein